MIASFFPQQFSRKGELPKGHLTVEPQPVGSGAPALGRAGRWEWVGILMEVKIGYWLKHRRSWLLALLGCSLGRFL